MAGKGSAIGSWVWVSLGMESGEGRRAIPHPWGWICAGEPVLGVSGDRVALLTLGWWDIGCAVYHGKSAPGCWGLWSWQPQDARV